jgi:hypothetical protein
MDLERQGGSVRWDSGMVGIEKAEGNRNRNRGGESGQTVSGHRSIAARSRRRRSCLRGCRLRLRRERDAPLCGTLVFLGRYGDLEVGMKTSRRLWGVWESVGIRGSFLLCALVLIRKPK